MDLPRRNYCMGDLETWHEIEYLQDSISVFELSNQDVCSILVELARLEFLALWENAKASSNILVEYGGKNARRIKPWNAEPIYRTVNRD